jgi:hypothetical protein
MNSDLLTSAADRWHRRWVTAILAHGREFAPARRVGIQPTRHS